MSDNYLIRSETNGRENNEDSFLVLTLIPLPEQPLNILAVADGMGGHAHGEHVSREALRKVSLALFEQLNVEPTLNRLTSVELVTPHRVAEVIWNTIQQTNHHIRRMVETNKWDKAGSTLVVAILLDQVAVVANLGDSPLFHYEAASGRLLKITQDHTIAGALLRAKMISTDMARHHEGRSRLEYFLGCERLPGEAQVRHVALTPGDLLLLCSDGVSGLLSIEELQTILAQSNTELATMADQLLQAALAAGETDNQTLILWRRSPTATVMLHAQPTLVTQTVKPSSWPTLVITGKTKGDN